MLDYKGIEALYAVLELQSFEEAAKKLHITQSAVSQRIKALEVFYGEPVLVRTQPFTLTKLGKYLNGHFKQVCLLEESLQLQMTEDAKKPHFSVALNRDSLETWFLDIVSQTLIFDDLFLEIIADDQARTLDYFKKGLVSSALSTSSDEIRGANTCFIGDMEYLLVASSTFKRKYFSKEKKFDLAPAIKFDKNDMLHERYVEKFFNFDHRVIPFQTVPSVKGFKVFTLKGYGYGLIPRIDIEKELEDKTLVELFPGKRWKEPLYWHYWSVQSSLYQKVNRAIMEEAKKKLSKAVK